MAFVYVTGGTCRVCETDNTHAAQQWVAPLCTAHSMLFHHQCCMSHLFHWAGQFLSSQGGYAPAFLAKNCQSHTATTRSPVPIRTLQSCLLRGTPATDICQYAHSCNAATTAIAKLSCLNVDAARRPLSAASFSTYHTTPAKAWHQASFSNTQHICHECIYCAACYGNDRRASLKLT
eukprot:GHRR01027164.1.p1 GENE.GHRR01027164.1~~GHRR01027164.1.p1  ORF type:complete len:177 (+),score=26.00 GHRR01027164.1:532-1062(+)